MKESEPKALRCRTNHLQNNSTGFLFLHFSYDIIFFKPSLARHVAGLVFDTCALNDWITVDHDDHMFLIWYLNLQSVGKYSFQRTCCEVKKCNSFLPKCRVQYLKSVLLLWDLFRKRTFLLQSNWGWLLFEQKNKSEHFSCRGKTQQDPTWSVSGLWDGGFRIS